MRRPRMCLRKGVSRQSSLDAILDLLDRTAFELDEPPVEVQALSRDAVVGRTSTAEAEMQESVAH